MVQVVLDDKNDYMSLVVAIVLIAPKIGYAGQTPQELVKKAEVDSSMRAGVPRHFAERVKAPEREKGRLRRVNEILREGPLGMAEIYRQ